MERERLETYVRMTSDSLEMVMLLQYSLKNEMECMKYLRIKCSCRAPSSDEMGFRGSAA